MINATQARQHAPRTESEDHSATGRPFRVLPGGVGAPKAHVLTAPRIKVLFERYGRPQGVEWPCAASGADGGAPLRQCAETSQGLSLTVQDPVSRLTWVDVDGLCFVDSSGRQQRSIEPYRITDVAILAGGFATTHSSVLAYRIREGRGAAAETRLTRVTAAFAHGTRLRLFFLVADSFRNPGRVSVFADVAQDADAFTQLAS